MRTSILIAVCAVLIGGTCLVSAQITLVNSATGGPPSATTVGTNHSLDGTNVKVGSGSCLLTGTSGSSYLPTAAALDPATAGSGGASAAPGFTIQWWYKVTQPTLFGYLWGDSGWGSFRCFQNGAAGTGNVIIRGPLTDLTTTAAPLQNAVDANGWIHLAVVVDSKANTTTWYVNGALNASGAANITGKGTNLKCMGYDGSSSNVPGNHDDIRIYNWARTAADIKADYLSGAAGNGPSGSPNVPDLGYYTCDLPTALTVSGTGQPGTKMTIDLLATGSTGLPYQLGTSLGTGPIVIGPHSLGLSPDSLLVASVGGFLPQIFVNYAGVLDAQGKGQAALNLLNDPLLVGVRLHTAFVTLDKVSPTGIKEVSNTASFTIVK